MNVDKEMKNLEALNRALAALWKYDGQLGNESNMGMVRVELTIASVRAAIVERLDKAILEKMKAQVEEEGKLK